MVISSTLSSRSLIHSSALSNCCWFHVVYFSFQLWYSSTLIVSFFFYSWFKILPCLSILHPSSVSILMTIILTPLLGDCMHAQLLNFVWLGDTTDYSPLSSSVHGISQARILEWVAIFFSRRSFQRLCISILFSSFSLGLSCPFIWNIFLCPLTLPILCAYFCVFNSSATSPISEGVGLCRRFSVGLRRAIPHGHQSQVLQGVPVWITSTLL